MKGEAEPDCGKAPRLEGGEAERGIETDAPDAAAQIARGFLAEGERAEDLEYKGLRIIQSERGYRFTTDSVILAGLTEAKAGDRVVDLGTGTGVIATLVAARTGAEVWGVELQASLADRAARTVRLNGMENRVRIVTCDLNDAYRTIGANCFEVAVANPPYYPIFDRKTAVIDKEANESEGSLEIKNAKFEYLATVNDFFRAAKRLLKFGGRFFVVSKAERLTDLLQGLRTEGLEPKTVVPIQPKPGAAVDTVVIKALKGGKPPLKMEAPFVICDEAGELSEEARRIYHR